MCRYRNREQAMVTVRPSVSCDPCLVPLIRALYENGFPTVASCCGHGRYPGWVQLEDGRELMLLDERWGPVVKQAIHERQCPKCHGDGEIADTTRKSTNSKGTVAYFVCERCDGQGFLLDRDGAA